MRTNVEFGCEGFSPVCSLADLPLGSANQLSQQIKISTYNIKQDTICKQSACVWSTITALIPTWIAIVVALISQVLSFLRTVNTVYILAHICTLHTNPATRAHGCPTALLQEKSTSSNSCYGVGSLVMQLIVMMLLSLLIDQQWPFAHGTSVHGWRACCQFAEVGGGTCSHEKFREVAQQVGHLHWPLSLRNIRRRKRPLRSFHIQNFLTQSASNMVSILNQFIHPQCSGISL